MKIILEDFVVSIYNDLPMEFSSRNLGPEQPYWRRNYEIYKMIRLGLIKRSDMSPRKYIKNFPTLEHFITYLIKEAKKKILQKDLRG